MPALCLGGQPAFVYALDTLVLAVTTAGKLQLWDVAKRSLLLKATVEDLAVYKQ